jgi:hypothetical protein
MLLQKSTNGALDIMNSKPATAHLLPTFPPILDLSDPLGTVLLTVDNGFPAWKDKP